MKKYSLVLVLLLAATLASAGKYKLSTTGKGDVYVPTLENDGKTMIVGSMVGTGAVPLGGMVSIMPSTDTAAWQPPATGVIKDGFMRADGAVITAAHKSQGTPFAIGTTLPNMISRYPRGNTTSGAVNGSNTVSISIPAHYHNSFSLKEAGHAVDGAYVAPLISGTTSFGGGNHTHVLFLWILSVADGHSNIGGLSTYPTVYTTSGGNTSFVYADYAGDHFHDVPLGTGTTNIAHSHPASVVSGSIGNQGGSNGDGAFGGTVSPDSGSAGNNEPSYIDVVWVIRVK